MPSGAGKWLAVVMIAAGGLGLLRSSGPTAPSTSSTGGLQDDVGLPGCLLIAGRPVIHMQCVPCPPASLGAPGMVCVGQTHIRITTAQAPPASEISLYPGGPTLLREDMTALGRPVVPISALNR